MLAISVGAMYICIGLLYVNSHPVIALIWFVGALFWFMSGVL